MFKYSDEEIAERASRLAEFVRTEGRESTLRSLLFAAPKDGQFEFMRATALATLEMTEGMPIRRGLVIVQRFSAYDRVVTTAAEIHRALRIAEVVVMYDRKRLERDLDHFLSFLLRCAQNKDGTADLVGMTSKASDDQPDPALAA